MTRFRLLILPTAVLIGSYTLPAQVAFTTPDSPEKKFEVSAPQTAQQVIDEAQLRFQEAKRLLQEGDKAGARVLFDRAINTLLLSSLSNDERAKAEHRMEELVDLIYKYDVDELGSGEDANKLAFEQSPLDELREMSFPIDPALKGLVQHQTAATASQLPLEMNDTVLSFVNYFSSSKLGRNTLINGWRRSHKYRPMIQQILAEEGVPQELIFLAQAESGFLPRARSVKAACGMWQFVSYRGKEYGLEQTPLIDLRLDPEKATRAAARHLKDLYMQFGDWYLAMAAYNCGPGCVDRAVQRTGYADYWQLHRLNALPKETRNYVPLILAMTIVTKNAEEYGIELEDPAPSLEYDTITMDAPTHIELVAGAADLPVSGIRDMNPAILKNTIPSGFEVHIPKGSSLDVLQAIDSVPSAQRVAWRLHRVKPGEDIVQIAQLYQTTPNKILSANTNVEDSVSEGDVLMVPASFATEKAAAKKSPVVHARKSGTGKRVAVKNSSKKVPAHTAVRSKRK